MLYFRKKRKIMNNNSDSVPARIVIVGTSKLKLSERFNRIPSQQNQIVRKEEVLSVNGGPIIQRPRVFNRPATNGGVISGKSFLHDDYMDNDLYGEASGHGPILGRKAQDSFTFLEEFDQLDPVKLSLDDYKTYNRIRPPFGHRSNFNMQSRDGYYGYDTAEMVQPPLVRTNYYNQPFHKPIQQRLSYKPRFSDFALRRPIRNTVVFKRPFRGRYGGSGRRFNNWPGRGGRGQYGKNRWNEKRFKKTIQEMDRELDEYMKSKKHPRVQPTT